MSSKHSSGCHNVPMPLSAGDRVALLVPGSTAYVDLVLALLRRGVFPVPLDPATTTSELDALVADLTPVRILRDPADVPALLSELDDSPLPASDVPLGRPVHVTSGTTGRRKGVFSGLLGESAAAALVAEERELWSFGPADVNLVLSPLHHSAPLRFALGTVLAGGRVVAPGPFDAGAVTAAITAERPTTMFCVPAHLQRLFAHWDVAGTPDLSSFRLVAHAGAPCPTHLKERLIAAFPPGSTWEFYGSTEGQFTACRSEEWRQRPGTVGRARPGRVMSVDEAGGLWCAVPSFARFEYLGAPDKTAAAWRETDDGPAFTVGDLGRIDDDGYVYLDGRREDLVISGGVNVYPAEVEDVLGEAPGVVEVAVFGVDDERWGQRVCAAVVGTADVEALTAYAREQLAPAKRPKDWFVLDGLPRTSTGKVRRLDLPALCT
ncbi:MAG: AMP-dependent synthetase [Nocardioidaceae bacterium]|nr:AMP-dependent synthetase [Nocardioidaceae bacterium]